MSEGGDEADKKHDPSESRLREAGERGELPRSPELSAVATTLALATALTIGASSVAAPVIGFAERVLAPPDGTHGVTLDAGGAHGLFTEALIAIGAAAAIPLGAAAAAAVIVGLAQTRFQVAPRAFEARLEHLDPLATFQRVYLSRQPLVELAKGLLQVGALGAVVAHTVWGHLDELPRLAAIPTRALPGVISELAWDLVVRALPVMMLLAAIDYGWSSWQWWTGMMRTDREVRDEHKESDGDPLMKAMRKRRMRELTLRGAMARLAEADVLVTNPTHFAIGLRYKPGHDAAPVVVVKGVDHLALRLRKKAQELDIPRVEDRALARALYAQVPQGKAVPATLYGPVARVLAIVWRRRKRRPTRPVGRPTPGR